MAKQRSSKMENNQKRRGAPRILPISIIIFVILAGLALYIILNKGKIGGYSLVKIEANTVSEEETVKKQEDKIEILSEKKYLSLKDKESSELSVLINDEIVDGGEVELSSSNEDIIKIKDGKAVPVSVGKATITAKKGDLQTTIDLRAIIPITSMTFTTTNSTVKVGKSLQMKLVAKPSDASIDTLKYESSDESIATVNSNGIVTGVAPGTVTITVMDKYSELEKSLKLTIKK